MHNAQQWLGLKTSFSNTLLSLKVGVRQYQKTPIMYFISAIVLAKVPQIHVKISTTVDTLASGLHYPAPS